MTAPSTTSTSSGSSGVDITQLLADLDSTTVAVQNNDWVSAGLDGASSALDLLGSGGDPLSGLMEAGFGWLSGLLQFLTAPLKTLEGDPSSTDSSAQATQSAGQQVSSTADSYQNAAGTQISGWSGQAASGYQNTAAQFADQLRAVGKATTGVSGAVSGAGKIVTQAQQQVGGLVTEATGKINTIMTQAMAAAQATGGASIAMAVPQAVGVATQYGEQIAQKLGALLSSSQNLAQLVLVLLRSLEAVNTLITQTTGKSTTTTTTQSA